MTVPAGTTVAEQRTQVDGVFRALQQQFPEYRVADVKMLAAALCGGILIGATIVRALLVPAPVSLMGQWNWWLPAWLATPLRVEPSPRVREPVDVPAQRVDEQVAVAPVA